jgi:hypothetical protein
LPVINQNFEVVRWTGQHWQKVGFVDKPAVVTAWKMIHCNAEFVTWKHRLGCIIDIGMDQAKVSLIDESQARWIPYWELRFDGPERIPANR